MIPARYEHMLFGLVLSGLMSCIVSGIATLVILPSLIRVMQGFLFRKTLSASAPDAGQGGST